MSLSTKISKYSFTVGALIPHSEAKQAVQYAGPLERLEAGYSGKEFFSEYGGIQQWWLLVYSEQAYLRESKTLEKQVQKGKDQATKELTQLVSYRV